MSASGSPAKKPAAEKSPKRRRSWPRRLLRLGVILVAVVLLLRLCLPLAIPLVLDSVAGDHGLACDYESLSLGLLSGEVELRGLVLTPAEGGDPVLRLRLARADLDVSSLLDDRIVVDRVEVDGLELTLDRDEAGRWPLLERLARAPSAEEDDEPEEPKPLTLDVPVAVRAIRVTDVRVHVRDAATPIETRVDATLLLTDLGVADAPARLDAEVRATGLLEALRIHGTARTGPEELTADLDVRVRGLRPRPLASVLRTFGIRPVAETVETGLTARLEARVTGRDTLSANLSVEGVTVRADGAQTARVDRLRTEIGELGPTAIAVARVAIEGVRWKGETLASGGIRTCGFETVPAPDGEAAPASAPEPAAEPAGPPPTISLAELAVTDVRAELTTPDRTLEVRVPEVRLRGYASDSDAPLELTARIAAPGLVEAVRLDGTVAPFAARRTASLALIVTGVESAPLADVLAAAGVELTCERSDLAARLEAEVESGPTLRANVRLESLAFRAGPEGLELARVAIRDVAIPEDGTVVRIGVIDVGGLVAALGRDAAGRLHGPGFRLVPPPPAPAAAATASAAGTAPTAESAPPPRIEIDRLVIGDNRIAFRDEAVEPVAEIEVAELRVEASDLVLPGDGSPATVGVRLLVPGVVEELSADGRVRLSGGSIDAQLEVVGRGLTAERARPYLAAAGLRPELESGELSLRIEARVDTDGDTTRATAEIARVRFADAGVELAGLDALRVRDVALDPGRVAVGSVEISRPRARVRRDAEGRLHVPGFALVPPPARAGAPRAFPPAAPASPVEPTAPPAVALGTLRLVGAELAWTDETAGGRVTVTPTLDVSVEDARYEDGRLSAGARLELRVPEEGTSLTATARATASGRGTTLALELAGDALRSGAFAPYLPRELGVTLREGRLRAKLDAEVAEAEGGGMRVRAEVREVDYRDGDESLLALESFRVDAPRIDLDGGVLNVEEISLAGLETTAARGADGTLRLLGLELRPAEPTAPSRATTVKPPPDSSRPPAARESLRDRLRRASETALPDVTVGRIDLGIRRLTVRDEAAPDARPLLLEDVRLASAGRVAVDGQEPAASPPLELVLTASAPGLVESIRVETRLGALLDEPEAALSLALEGIRGAGLATRVPALADVVDAGSIRDGRLRLEVHGVLRLRRRHALDFDLSKGFGLELGVKDFALTQGDGTLLAGLTELHADVTRVDPATGDVHVRSVEVVGPRGDVTREPGGLRVMGLLLRNRAPAPETAASGGSAAPSAGAASPARAAGDGPEIRVDSLYVTGVRSRIEDVSVSPPFRMPIEDLTLEVRGFTTRAFTRTLPVAFSALVRAGEISLPSEPGKTVRPLEEIAVSGRLTLHPHLDGWVKAGISALDLANLGGLAKQAKVDLSGGVLDLGTTVRFREDGVMDTSTRITLTDLDLSEAPDGPISRLLVLPAPLDVVLFVLEDAGGAIDIPLDVRVDEEGIGTGAIVGQSVKVLSLLIADAVASSPFKVLGTAGGILGLGSDDALPSDEPPVEISFASGGAAVRPGMRDLLRDLTERLADEEDLAVTIEHAPGRGDLERLRERANPSRRDCLDLVARLRRQRREVLRARVRAAENARAALAAAGEDAAEAARRHLASLDRELGLTEQALDRVAALLRPGAERQSERRTREASVALAAIRLREVRQALLDGGIPDLRKRIRIRRPRAEEPERDGGGVIRIGLTRMAETD